MGERSPGFHAHVEAAGEEAFEHLKIGGGELGDACGRKGNQAVRLRSGRAWGKELRSECARAGIAPLRRLNLAIAHNKSAGRKVAEPLMLLGDEHGDDANRIEERKLVDVSDQVSGHRLEKPNGAA